MQIIAQENFIETLLLEKLQGTAAELEAETGGKVLCVSCDVRNWDEVEAMKEATIKEFGRIDILLNNAAGNFISPTERLTHSAFDSILDIVLKGTKNCTLSVGKYWIDNKIPGTVLNIVTTYSWTGSAYVVPSACAKAGVLACVILFWRSQHSFRKALDGGHWCSKFMSKVNNKIFFHLFGLAYCVYIMQDKDFAFSFMI